MYYVYENWRVRPHKARIHLANCRHCNHGAGITTGTHPDNGKWHGPYTTLRNARIAAQKTGGRVSRCMICLK